MAEEPWSFEVRCPSCGHQHQQWGRGDRPSSIPCHCNASIDLVCLTRQALYEAVWTQPLSNLAQVYAMSDVGLKKLCRRILIPVPFVGYWQQRAHGRVPERAALPPAPERFRDPIVLVKRPPKTEQAAPPSDVAELLARERSAEARIQVAQQLRNPHPLVRQASDVLSHAKPDASSGLVRPSLYERCLDLSVSPATLPRALRIMNALARAAEERRWPVTVEQRKPQGTYVTVLGHAVQVGLVEKTKRLDHALNKTEREEVQKHGRTWGPRWDYRPTGVLELRLKDSAGHGLRRTWADADGSPLEERLNAVLAGIVFMADAKRVEQVRLERQRQAWQEAERRRWEAEARRREDAERRQRLETDAAAWEKSRQLQQYIYAVERDAIERGQSVVAGKDLQEWLKFARVHADSLDPIRRSRATT
jgi:hypothetical protein